MTDWKSISNGWMNRAKIAEAKTDIYRKAFEDLAESVSYSGGVPALGEWCTKHQLNHGKNIQPAELLFLATLRNLPLKEDSKMNNPPSLKERLVSIIASKGEDLPPNIAVTDMSLHTQRIAAQIISLFASEVEKIIGEYEEPLGGNPYTVTENQLRAEQRTALSQLMEAE